MSDHTDDRTWSVARLLFATQLPFLLIVWVVFAAAVVALTVAIHVLGTVNRSVWDPAVTVVRWFALGYGVYLVNRLLPVLVAHGRTRREFLHSVALFVVAAGAVVAALLAAGFAIEGLLYRILDLPQRVAPERLFDAPTQYPRVSSSPTGPCWSSGRPSGCCWPPGSTGRAATSWWCWPSPWSWSW